MQAPGTFRNDGLDAELKALFGMPLRMRVAWWILDQPEDRFDAVDAKRAVADVGRASMVDRALNALEDAGLLHVAPDIGRRRKAYLRTGSPWWQALVACRDAFNERVERDAAETAPSESR